MTIFYGVACILSLLFLVGCFFVDKKQNKWIMCIFISIFVCNSGYFITSISKSLTLALFGNSIGEKKAVYVIFDQKFKKKQATLTGNLLINKLIQITI